MVKYGHGRGVCFSARGDIFTNEVGRESRGASITNTTVKTCAGKKRRGAIKKRDVHDKGRWSNMLSVTGHLTGLGFGGCFFSPKMLIFSQTNGWPVIIINPEDKHLKALEIIAYQFCLSQNTPDQHSFKALDKDDLLWIIGVPVNPLHRRRSSCCLSNCFQLCITFGERNLVPFRKFLGDRACNLPAQLKSDTSLCILPDTCMSLIK